MDQSTARAAASIHELLVADQADLGHAQPLRTGHDHGHVPIGDQLVRSKVHLRLIGHGGHLSQAVLQILPESGGGMLLFWPAPAGLRGFVLEASDPLVPSVWAPVTNSTASNQSWTETLIGADGAQRFFRLRQP